MLTESTKVNDDLTVFTLWTFYYYYFHLERESSVNKCHNLPRKLVGRIKWTKWKIFCLSYREKVFAILILDSLSPPLPTIVVDLNSSHQILTSGEHSALLENSYHHKEASLENSLYN